MFIKALIDLHPLLGADSSYALAGEREANHSMILLVTLSNEGGILGIESLKEGNKGKSMLVPRTAETADSGAGIYPQPGYSRNVEDAFGLPKTDLKTKRVDTERGKKAFEAWGEMHKKVVVTPENAETLSPFQRFLEAWKNVIVENQQEPTLKKLLKLGEKESLPTGGGVVFLIGKAYAHDALWAKKIATENCKKAGGKTLQCAISGAAQKIPETHPKIKVGKSANALFSVNTPAFESYGNSSSIAGIGEESAKKYGAVLNALVLHGDGKTHKSFLGETAYVFWAYPTLSNPELELLFGEGEEESKAQDTQTLKEAKATLQHMKAGRSTESTTRIHILGLKPATGRTAVTFYKEIGLEEFQKKIKQHETDFEVPGLRGKTKQLWQLRGAFNIKKGQSQKAKDLTASDINLLLSSVIEGTNYPESLPLRALTELKIRNKLSEKKLTEKDKNHRSNQICYLQILAGWLHRNKKENKKETMNSNLYRLGQALRIAQECQYKVHNPKKEDEGKRPNKGIVERFGTLLCERPTAAFAQFISLHQNHVTKLRGLGLKNEAMNFEESMREVLSGKAELPSRTSPTEQTQFWLGYYSKPNVR